MRTRLYTLLAILLTGVSVSAQEVKPINSSVDDYITLLNHNGFQAYSFDLSPLKDTTYRIVLEKREYVLGNPEPIHTEFLGRGFKTRTLVKDFMWRERSEDELSDIKAAAVDFENGVYSLANKITVGFLPCQNDSTEIGRIIIENQGSCGFSMKLKPIEHNGSYDDNIIYKYKPVPFKASTFETDKFIPLATYASFWFDEAYKIIRFCGETEIDPELTAEILKNTPHYYVLGVTFNKAE